MVLMLKTIIVDLTQGEHFDETYFLFLRNRRRKLFRKYGNMRNWTMFVVVVNRKEISDDERPTRNAWKHFRRDSPDRGMRGQSHGELKDYCSTILRAEEYGAPSKMLGWNACKAITSGNVFIPIACGQIKIILDGAHKNCRNKCVVLCFGLAGNRETNGT